MHVRPSWFYVCSGAAIVVILDVVYSLLTKYAHMPYALFTIAQIAFYAAVAWFVASATRNLIIATFVTFATALVDATAGWAISAALLGEGLGQGGATVIVIAAIFTVAFMTGVGALSAFITLKVRHS